MSGSKGNARLLAAAAACLSLLGANNLVFAQSGVADRCTPHPACNRTIVVASKETSITHRDLAPVPGNPTAWMGEAKTQASPQRIRVAPLVNKYEKCCCNSDCSSMSGKCC